MKKFVRFISLLLAISFIFTIVDTTVLTAVSDAYSEKAHEESEPFFEEDNLSENAASELTDITAIGESENSDEIYDLLPAVEQIAFIFTMGCLPQ